MSGQSLLRIEFLEKADGEWFDLGLRRVLRGVIYAYRVEDETSGEWLLNVKICERAGKAVVIAVSSERTSSLHDQIKRKTVIFNACKDRERYYHPLGIGYVADGRFHYERVDTLGDVPEEIKNKFDLDKYEAVSPVPPSKTFKGKMVAVVEKDKPEKMALLFVLEKIRPVFSG